MSAESEELLRSRTHCLLQILPAFCNDLLFLSWWRIPSSALPYRWLVAKYPYLLPSSMPYGPRSCEAEHPHQLFSARWFLVQRVSSSLLVVLEQRQWHRGGLPQGPNETGVQRTLNRRTSPYRRPTQTSKNTVPISAVSWASRIT